MPNKNYYREKLLQEIKAVPEEMTPTLYKIVHLLNAQWDISSESRKEKRGSLRGIWKGSIIDESLFIEARKSLFSYEVPSAARGFASIRPGFDTQVVW